MLPLTRSRNRARFFGIPFSPSTLFQGGTVAGAWYDPSDLSTMFTTSAGTTPVAMPGLGSAVSVGRMLDKSGNGNHAIAFNNTTARPELRARVNLLTYSEEFDNGAWDKARLTISANTPDTTDPLGGNTADKGTETTDNGTHRIYQIVTTTANATFTGFIYFKKGTRQWVWTSITVRKSADATFINQYFDLDNISLGQQTTVQIGGTVVATFVSANIIDAGNGWRKATIVCTTQNTPTSVEFYAGLASADGTNSYAGSTSEYGYIWGADLRPANIGANVPAYQRIADANTYDTSGFPLYLRFDGIDDSMYTPANLNLSGTDKVAVFAGVRKIGTTASVCAELSAASFANAGSFGFYPENIANSWAATLRGASNTRSVNATTYISPLTSVVSTKFDIAQSLTLNAIEMRVNGATGTVTPTDPSANLGGGNFGTYPLYIGARNNSSLWFNGHLHSLIIAGSAVSAGNISATEQWVAGRTGIQI